MLLGENGIITQAQRTKTDTDEAALKEKLDMITLEREINGAVSSTLTEDETDVFLEMMGDKEITQEDINSFNETLQSYGKQLTAINNASDIQKIGADENYPLDGLYVLLADVSMSGQNWIAIGTEEEPFTGVLNGNNKTIDGLTLTNPEMNAGLFGVNSGSVKNVELTNTSITSAHTFVGGIAGQNNGLIENCHIQSGTISGTGNDNVQDVITGEIINGGSRVGGISGQNNDGGMIQNCTNTSAVTGEYRLVGGICGYSIGGDIINCENRGEIQGTYQVGGIAGDSEGQDVNNISHVTNCTNYGNINQVQGTENEQQAQLGGIVGCNFKYSIVDNCTNEGAVIGECSWIGGSIGVNYYIIQNSINKGEVKNQATIQDKASYTGGIVGYSIGSIYHCENSATISSSETASLYVGGIAGSIHRNSTHSVFETLIIQECYNSGNVSGCGNVGGIVGRLSTNCSIDSCANTGNIQGEHRVAGISGSTVSDSIQITNVYNRGDITASSDYIGGIIGISYIPLQNCYNTGSVTTTSSANVGGIVGAINSNYLDVKDMKNAYYLESSSTKAIGNYSLAIETVGSKTSDGIKTLADLLGNGFKNVTDSYPKLSWE